MTTAKSGLDVDPSPSATEPGVQGIGEELKHEGRRIADDVRAQATSYAEAQKEHVAERMEGVASTLRDASKGLHEREEEAAAGLTESAADQIERVSHLLRERNLANLVHEASDLARRHPAIFLGAAVALGFLAGRFVRASSEHGRNDAVEEPPFAPGV